MALDHERFRGRSGPFPHRHHRRGTRHLPGAWRFQRGLGIAGTRALRPAGMSRDWRHWGQRRAPMAETTRQKNLNQYRLLLVLQPFSRHRRRRSYRINALLTICAPTQINTNGARDLRCPATASEVSMAAGAMRTWPQGEFALLRDPCRFNGLVLHAGQSQGFLV